MGKIVGYIAVVAILLGSIYFALVKFNILPNAFASSPVTISETPVIIKEIKNIANLFSICYYNEIVYEYSKNEETAIDATSNLITGIFGAKKSYTKRNLVLIVRGRTFGGFDLSKIDSTRISVNDTVINIKLDPPKIIDVVVNPSDITTFIEEGKWTTAEVNRAKIIAKDHLKLNAMKNGILNKTKINGTKSLTAFYKALGFGVISSPALVH